VRVVVLAVDELEHDDAVGPGFSAVSTEFGQPRCLAVVFETVRRFDDHFDVVFFFLLS